MKRPDDRPADISGEITAKPERKFVPAATTIHVEGLPAEKSVPLESTYTKEQLEQMRGALGSFRTWADEELARAERWLEEKRSGLGLTPPSADSIAYAESEVRFFHALKAAAGRPEGSPADQMMDVIGRLQAHVADEQDPDLKKRLDGYVDTFKEFLV